MVLCVSGKKKTLTATPPLLDTSVAGKASTTTLLPITIPTPSLTPTKTRPIIKTSLLSWATRPAHSMITAGLLPPPPPPPPPPPVQISPPMALGPPLL
ncbi:hypothetical protein E2C01_059216 [Portunus trituberculatus]|uniref:Uncharacterized protein n=1 Tax=Portunus trituberculatus TaxID=210409 RepID=A0A5B7GYK2_PORTR|nr:hypothetical protein [Portunus trituberculatus]